MEIFTAELIGAEMGAAAVRAAEADKVKGSTAIGIGSNESRFMPRFEERSGCSRSRRAVACRSC